MQSWLLFKVDSVGEIERGRGWAAGNPLCCFAAAAALSTSFLLSNQRDCVFRGGGKRWREARRTKQAQLMGGRRAISMDVDTVELVFKDFKARRAGLVKALTQDVEDFFVQCDPKKQELCLYGFPDEAWEVGMPEEEVPPELPEPVCGINFAKDAMQRDDWLALVAIHSDAWLLAVSCFYSAGFDKNERKRLLLMSTELPTLFEIVTGKASEDSIYDKFGKKSALTEWEIVSAANDPMLFS